MKINQIVLTESEQLNELDWKSIQRGAKNVAKGADKFTKNVADTGAAVGQAAGAVGGAIKQVGKTAIADPVSATYNAAKSGLNKAADVAAGTYGDVKTGAQKIGQAAQTVGTDVGNAGKAVGQGIKAVGTAAGKTLGGAAQAVGAVPGAVAGIPGAMGKGFDSAKSTVSGNPIPPKADAAAPAAAGAEQKDAQGNIIQRGLGKVAGAVGAVAGVPAGMGRAFDAGKARGADAVAAAGGEKQPADHQPGGAAIPTTGAAGKEAGPEVSAAESSKVTSIKRQISHKQAEIAALQRELQNAMQEQPAEAPAGTGAGAAIAGAGQKAAGALSGMAAAVQRGAFAPAGTNVAASPEAAAGKQTVTDRLGKKTDYHKVGNQWVDAQNQPIDPNMAAMLDKQQKPTGAAVSTPAAAPSKPGVAGRIAKQLPPAEKVTIGGQTLNPANPADAKIIQRVQSQTKPAAAPTAAAPTPAAAPAPSFKQGANAGYSNVKMNAPTGIPTTGKTMQPTPSAPAKQPEMASFDPSAALLRKMKIKLA